MSRYYSWQSQLYDATRWTFLYDRNAILDDLELSTGQIVVEVGCGTGRNFEGILNRIGETGEILAVDCARPMIEQCAKRLARRRLNRVHLLEQEYGFAPVARGCADAVLLSYSLSMIPSWEGALECASQELRPGGRIAVVDFCLEERTSAALGFARWMATNHVMLDRPYREKLASVFRPLNCVTRKAFGGLWSFFRFVGERA
jgi:S-adenosylmethionine-diacylgycerolhomoserine-N-methlytransferase